MRINIIQHTPNEGPGYIRNWADLHDYDLYIYHPQQFSGILPQAKNVDMLIILGSPMNPNDSFYWIEEERKLILELIDRKIPIFGVCFGAQQIAKAMGYNIKTAKHKEVGWAPVYLRSNIIPNIPKKFTTLHWHQDMFEMPAEAVPLFSSDLLENQGFLLGERIIGLQFHLESTPEGVRELVINDHKYPEVDNSLGQSGKYILREEFPASNEGILYMLLDFITK
ncbi:type 1 glutamine amidotransferase [Enterococcus faecalis]|uniref:type 1 glutamine amidotransferase n=1 Tax=Enterococcus faecalis TaxID=1351 RepID=UPI002DB63A3F|nr:type 1 glutamine amidotransferase [Enterococcus faecalis]MEB7792171.1 type 1 glutamine amidotransferase [Enterococcus faecalis]MEB7810185.1 type 1 glutamine amidotransferase [Enterococcus faecalis]